MSMTIETAIKRSVSHTEIVTLDWTEESETYLLAECEDSVTTGDRIEVWGTTDDGDEWRVHLTGPREASCETRGPGHDELRRWREQGRAPAGSCPFCASRISVIERDGVFVARCSHRGCGARGPKHHDLTRACDLFCCPPQRTAGGMGGIDAGGAL